MNDNQKERRDFLKQVSASLIAGTVATQAFAENSTAQSSQFTKNSENQTACNSKPHAVPFYGEHQAGITTAQQKHIYFLVADLHTTDLNSIKEMFQQWTAYSANLAKGQFVKPISHNGYVPPADTGEALDLDSHNLTLTFGVSPSFFQKLNIEKLKPKELANLPHFPRDQIQEQYSGGDICIQACADDPQVAFHAVRNLVRAARANITMKWSQSGFNSFDHAKNTPRNLFAFKDGTANFTDKKLDDVVWTTDSDWFNGGSYLVARRIKMFLETWDRTSLNEQENTFGRHRENGAAMGQKAEHDPVDLSLTDKKGNAVVPEDSHVHLAHKTGKNLLRRSFSYASGIDDKGQFDTGLLFISFQKSPEQFITIQNAFGNVDKMNEYITHIGSGIFACFPGVKDENDYLGKSLFEQL